MKRIICQSPGVMQVVDVDKPIAQPNHVVVHIKYIGICGTDIHAFAGNQPFFEYPRVLGHELAGLIDSVGEGVDMVVGQPVYVIPYLSCGTCIACRDQKPNCCTAINVIGVHTDGGMCEYLQVPVSAVVKTDDIALEQMAIIECLAIGAHAVRRAEIKPNNDVLVVGAGPIGIGIAQFAKARQAKVIMMDVNAERLAFCQKSLGIDAVIQADDQATEALSRLTDNAFFPTVFDATGNPKAMEKCFQWVAHGGKLIFVSVVTATIQFSDPAFHQREMTLLGSRNATKEDFEHVTDCLRKGTVVIEPMITHRGHLVDLPALMPSWCQRETGVIKAVVNVS
ncbi:MAG: zinc-binding alcohol dehydrogenase family protein [Ostreibacterium sp.]